METQNITLSLPKRTLKKIKIIAAKRQKSISALLTDLLEQIADEENGYLQARKRQMDFLDAGINLGTNGEILITRDELHERR